MTAARSSRPSAARAASAPISIVAASKLFLAESLLVDVTLRETKANQFGILGFGGDKHNDYSTQFEGSAAYLFSRRFAMGAELRTKPSNLGVAHEGAAWDLFAAYFFNKNLSVTAAYADLGNIVIQQRSAWRLSVAAGRPVMEDAMNARIASFLLAWLSPHRLLPRDTLFADMGGQPGIDKTRRCLGGQLSRRSAHQGDLSTNPTSTASAPN